MKLKPVRTLPIGYTEAGSVSPQNSKDLKPMLLWSILLPLFYLMLLLLVLQIPGTKRGTGTFVLDSIGDLLLIFGGVLLVLVLMVVVHEGLHGLVFWFATGDAPKFEFKLYYASANPGDWYLPRGVFIAATLMPLLVISTLSLVLLPFVSGMPRFLLILLAVLNASGAAGDWLVVLRLRKLPADTLIKDSGARVVFYIPSGLEL